MKRPADVVLIDRSADGRSVSSAIFAVRRLTSAFPFFADRVRSAPAVTPYGLSQSARCHRLERPVSPDVGRHDRNGPGYLSHSFPPTPPWPAASTQRRCVTRTAASSPGQPASRRAIARPLLSTLQPTSLLFVLAPAQWSDWSLLTNEVCQQQATTHSSVERLNYAIRRTA